MAWLGQNWVGLEICALVKGSWSPGSTHRHTLVSSVLCPTGFPLTEAGNKMIPSRSRVSQEAKRI